MEDFKVILLILSLSSQIVVTVGVDGEAFGPDGPSHDQVVGDYEFMPKGGFPKETAPGFKGGCAGKYAKPHRFLKTSIPDIIKESGYNFEEHRVRSEKGYKLGVFRIPGSPISPMKPGKIPIILNHGSIGNSLSWLFQDGNNSLGFKLANAGYDVWLINHRGSNHSTEHEVLDIKGDQFWDFTFHEKAVEDVAAIIDHILNVTGLTSLYYAGHSQGTIQMTILLSERPEYSEKVRVNFYLAPATVIKHATAVGLNLLMALGPDWAAWKTAIGNQVSRSKIQKFMGETCNAEVLGCDICENLVDYMNGGNSKEIDLRLSDFFERRYYDSASSKSLCHLAQFKKTGRFAKFQYPTPEENIKKYGKPEAPDYDRSKIRTPIVVFWGYSDEMTVKEDVKQALAGFPQGILVEINRVHLESFTHLDHLYAKDIQKLVYDRIQWIMDTGKHVRHGPNGTVNPVGYVPTEPAAPPIPESYAHPVVKPEDFVDFLPGPPVPPPPPEIPGA